MLDIQSVVHSPAASATPGSLLAMQNLRLCPGTTESESAFNKNPPLLDDVYVC